MLRQAWGLRTLTGDWLKIVKPPRTATEMLETETDILQMIAENICDFHYEFKENAHLPVEVMNRCLDCTERALQLSRKIQNEAAEKKLHQTDNV